MGGQCCRLKPNPGRNPRHGPWPHSLGRHYPLPCTTRQEQSSATPPLPSPPSPIECSAARTHFTHRASGEEPAPGHIQDPPGWVEPAPSHRYCRACLPHCAGPRGAPACAQDRLLRLVFGKTLFEGGGMGALGLTWHLAPRQHWTGRCQRRGSTRRRCAAKPPSSSGGFLNSINLLRK